MPDSDRDVFDFLTGDTGTSTEIDFITYAVFAFHKREWMTLHEATHKRPPSQSDIDNWISNLTSYQFASMRLDATNFFDRAAREYMAEDMAEDMATAVAAAQRTELVKAVRSASAFWKQLFVGLVTAVLTPFIIAGFIVLGIVFSSRFPSPTDVAKWFGYFPPVPVTAQSDGSKPEPASGR